MTAVIGTGLLTLSAVGFASALWAIALLSQDGSLWEQLQDWLQSWQQQPVLQPVPVRVRRPRRLPR
jgi:hypothetical protein